MGDMVNDVMRTGSVDALVKKLTDDQRRAYRRIIAQKRRKLINNLLDRIPQEIQMIIIESVIKLLIGAIKKR